MGDTLVPHQNILADKKKAKKFQNRMNIRNQEQLEQSTFEVAGYVGDHVLVKNKHRKGLVPMCPRFFQKAEQQMS
ncbi:MAG: hypothetical protein RLZZ308_251 [Candidatus Parcubacteria bacterium]